ncbi:hypothetical protein WJX73_007180 [Symbiochloris irregularis]|uniref:Uncharacterized protein n=1 Tax=Symbiochloris irregularis TaxID=706552 RepID=A0AAW1PNM9_9CHLO
MAPFNELKALAAANSHMSGARLHKDTKCKPIMYDKMDLVQPGGHDWLMLQNLRMNKVSSGIRKEYMKRLKWYQRNADNGEFAFDFVSACDLLCWARDNFSRNGDRYPGENPDILTPKEFNDFALVMEDFFDEGLGKRNAPRILDVAMCCHVYYSSSVDIRTGNQGFNSELLYTVMALEKAGRPPKRGDDI